MEEVIIIRVSNPNSGFMKQLERMIEKYECESRKVTSKKRCLTFEKIKIYPHIIIKESIVEEVNNCIPMTYINRKRISNIVITGREQRAGIQ